MVLRGEYIPEHFRSNQVAHAKKQERWSGCTKLYRDWPKTTSCAVSCASLRPQRVPSCIDANHAEHPRLDGMLLRRSNASITLREVKKWDLDASVQPIGRLRKARGRRQYPAYSSWFTADFGHEARTATSTTKSGVTLPLCPSRCLPIQGSTHSLEGNAAGNVDVEQMDFPMLRQDLPIRSHDDAGIVYTSLPPSLRDGPAH